MEQTLFRVKCWLQADIGIWISDVSEPIEGLPQVSRAQLFYKYVCTILQNASF